MDGDEGVVELDALPAQHKAKVTLVYRDRVLAFYLDEPARMLDDDEIGVEETAVDP